MSPRSRSNPILCNPTEEHHLLRADGARFHARGHRAASRRARPLRHAQPRALFEECGKLGLLGITVPAEDGGAGMDAVGAVIAHHEMSQVRSRVYARVPRARDALREQLLLHVQRRAARALPCQGHLRRVGGRDGDDRAERRHRRHRHEDRSPSESAAATCSTGRKALITNAPDADIFLVYAKLDGRITSFVLERSFEGLSTSSPTHKMGMRASTMGEIVMDGCFVPAENLLGGEGQGRPAHDAQPRDRAHHAGRDEPRHRRSLPRHHGELRRERTAFGRPLAEFGQIQRYIGESYAKTEAARALIYNVARTIRHDRKNRLGSDAAKLFAAPVGKEVADNAMQVLGGWGYCDEFKVERFLARREAARNRRRHPRVAPEEHHPRSHRELTPGAPVFSGWRPALSRVRKGVLVATGTMGEMKGPLCPRDAGAGSLPESRKTENAAVLSKNILFVAINK